VTDNNANGSGSLAAAITAANTAGGTNTITFDAGLMPITLTGAPLPAISSNLSIDGSGSPVITNTGTGGVFLVTAGNVTFENITVDGLTSNTNGGAINVDDSDASDLVTVENSTFDHDDAGTGNNGGAVANVGASTVDVTNSTLENDEAASGDGGAIYNGSSGTVTVSGGSLFDDDSAENGGAIDNAGVTQVGSLNVNNSTLQGNTATVDGGAVDNGDGASVAELVAGRDIFIANTAGVDGGAIDNGDAGGSAGLLATGDEFTGNTATIGHGGAIYDSGNSSVGSDIWGSTFVGDEVAAAVDGYAIDGIGTNVTVASDLFVEDCAGAITSAGYSAAMPATAGGMACVGAGTGDQVSSAAGDVGPASQDGQLKVPVYPNPAIDLIPDHASVTFGGVTTQLCPISDLFADASPDSTGHCDAGAMQVVAPPEVTNPGGQSGAGGTSTTATTTMTPPPSSKKKTVTTTVKFDNQLITLVSPSMSVCTAAGKSLSTTLRSKAIKHSKKPKLKFRLATFTTGGKDRHTAKRLPAKQSITLKGLKAHRTDRIRIVVSYRKPRKHRKSASVSKRITVEFKVC
jgi:hypothetical protein